MFRQPEAHHEIQDLLIFVPINRFASVEPGLCLSTDLSLDQWNSVSSLPCQIPRSVCYTTLGSFLPQHNTGHSGKHVQNK